MAEKPANSKAKEKLLEEKEKLEAERERSLAVVGVKQAHKTIEDTEKLRNRSAMISVSNRIRYLERKSIDLAEMLLKAEGENPVAQGAVLGSAVESTVKIYESIRFDIQKTLNINGEDFEKLFPKMEVKTQNRSITSMSLVDICEQLTDMDIYCQRMLK